MVLVLEDAIEGKADCNVAAGAAANFRSPIVFVEPVTALRRTEGARMVAGRGN